MPQPTEDQTETIALLSRGATYGQPGAPVERIDTHISAVFLVADRVFKLKRALRYPYLDYSTAARREAMCRAELRLNRRTAPELYLGLHAVTRERDGSLALDGIGRPVDWLVEMRRFPQECLFDRLAEKHALTPALMTELADRIAAFHAEAEPCGHGHYSEAMHEIVAGNARELRSAGAALDPAKVEALIGAMAATLDRLAALLDRRRAGGYVRHCHGDLHLRNICLIDSKPTLFDGIEFNDALICIDTLYDLAFLLMDLDHRGLDDLASIVFNRYLDRNGETEGLALLPFYLSDRAAVRSKVSIAAIAQQRDEAGKRDFAAEARQYLDAALALLKAAAPRLIAVGGLSGSGKSSLARALAPQFAPVPGARILRTDMIRKRLAGVAPETRLPESAYTIDMNERVYRALCEQAAQTLEAGYSVIADAAFLKEAERAAIAAVAAQAGRPFTGLWLEAPAEPLRQRIVARRGDASDADLAVLEKQLDIDPGRIDWRKLDASGTVAATAATARGILAEAEKA